LPAGQAATGVVAWDLRAERSLSLPVDAVVERLLVRAPFDAVRAGQPLAALRAPAWSTALAEANALSQSGSAEARALYAAAQARLRALGLPPGARRGKDGTITLSAPVAGVVSEIGVREGQAVPAGTPMFRINGGSSPWIEAALPPAAQAGVAPGTAVRVRAVSLPGEVLAGRVESLLPQVDAVTRTRRARILLDAPEVRLAPGEYVQVELRPDGGAEDRLVVPSEAVIEDGRGARVIVLAEGRFVPTAVQTGRSGSGRTEILSGLQGGEKVVVSGQFLVDSEANLSGALDRLGAEAR
jgi:Cu(I)/Ag(I) efflux system membrane fusion protein